MINALKTLINGMIEYVKSMKSDWNENDPTNPHYVKNRTHWAEPATVTVIPEQEIQYFEPVDSFYMYDFIPSEELLESLDNAEKTYKVIFDGVQYECNSVNLEGMCIIGNLSIIGEGEDTGEPFIMVPNERLLASNIDGSHTISCTTDGVVYHKLSLKYLENREILENFYWHKSEAMTLEEANAYNKIFRNYEKGFFLRWDRYRIIDLQVDGSKLSFWCDSYTLYNIPISDDNLFYLKDVEPILVNIGYLNSTHMSINKGKPVIISMPTSTGAATETSLFKVEKNGLKKGQNFEVLGNGTVKAYSVILPSTTADSTKKFRITVDDTGALSATEVTS